MKRPRQIKLPCIWIYTGDWLKDANLSKCREATRGIWMDALCVMHDDYRSGILAGSPEQLARVLRTTPQGVVRAAKDLLATKTADVTLSPNHVTLINRRMKRERQARESGRIRKCRSRVTASSQANPPPLSSSYSSSYSSSVQGKGIPPSELILREKELKRVETLIIKLHSFRNEWTEADRSESKRQKERRKELLKILGMSA